MRLTANTRGLDAMIARLAPLASGSWRAPALEAMAPALEAQLRAKLAGNRRAVGLLKNLSVRVEGMQLVVSFPDFARRFRDADFARGDLSSYTASLGAIASRVAAEALGV